MTDQTLFTRAELAERWHCSTRTIDRLRRLRRLAWLNISGKQGRKPLIRFPLNGIQKFEQTGEQNDGADND
jgi:MarR-like DNA-binding transcriptional regulator SgrR of sgrS sRNA